jgi:uncharacterized protein (TIGR02246 family)
MTKRILIVLLSLLFSFPAFAQKEKAPDVKEALAAWVAAVESGDADSIVDLYDPRAIMISTFAQKPMLSHGAMMKYYKKVVSNPDIKIDVEEQHPRSFGNTAVNTGLYTFHYTEDGEPVTIPARFSFTYVLRDGKWMIVDHHSSRVPLADEVK